MSLRRAAELHALRREENLDALVGPGEQEQQGGLGRDRPALEHRLRKTKVSLLAEASSPAKKTDQRRRFELSESIARQREEHVGGVVERQQICKRGAQRLAPGDRDRFARPSRDGLFELPVRIGESMLENEVRQLRTHRFEQAEEPEGRARARRQLAGDVQPGRQHRRRRAARP